MAQSSTQPTSAFTQGWHIALFHPTHPPLLSCRAAVTQPLGNQDGHAAGAMLPAPLPPLSHVPRERTTILGRQRMDGVKGKLVRNSSWQETGTSSPFSSGHSSLVVHYHHFTRTGARSRLSREVLSPLPHWEDPFLHPSYLMSLFKAPSYTFTCPGAGSLSREESAPSSQIQHTLCCVPCCSQHQEPPCSETRYRAIPIASQHPTTSQGGCTP